MRAATWKDVCRPAPRAAAATAVFTFHGGSWHTAGRVVFNHTPDQTVTAFPELQQQDLRLKVVGTLRVPLLSARKATAHGWYYTHLRNWIASGYFHTRPSLAFTGAMIRGTMFRISTAGNSTNPTIRSTAPR